jgi:hypothetical protein
MSDIADFVESFLDALPPEKRLAFDIGFLGTLFVIDVLVALSLAWMLASIAVSSIRQRRRPKPISKNP